MLSGTRKPSAGKRSLRSLAAAGSLSVVLIALSFFNTSSSGPGKAAPASMVAIVRVRSVASEAVLALAVWMAWAEGGLHARPAAILLPYTARLACVPAWAPLMLGHGTARGPHVLRGHGRRRRGVRTRVRRREPHRRGPLQARRHRGRAPRCRQLQDALSSHVCCSCSTIVLRILCSFV
ncbi:hypothetical protein PAHAL_5G327700 [Panicum hallii]|uniref:Uncharacterized protein n=1 Tax=Panicum hallii TaxID=206008 RepID=A0A2T8ILY2_9POAL|nr:hypothetical protein PAHAL_5G327700 [Panicum hallii]